MSITNYQVTKSNRLVEASYMMSLQEFKLISACIAKLDPRKEVPDTSTITASEFSDLMGIGMNNAYTELKKASKNLYNQTITLKNDTAGHDEMRWVWRKTQNNKGDGCVTIHWSPEIKKYLGQLRSQFTSVKLRYIGAMSSIYAVRLFEMLMQFQTTGQRVVPLSDFRAMLCIQDKYPVFEDLKKRVLKPALDEINAKTNWIVRYEQQKTGRNVTGLVLYFSEDIQGKLPLGYEELE